MAVRDIVAIGASAGGFEAIQILAAGLPTDLKAAVFVTLHVHSRGPGNPAAHLNRAGPFPAVEAEDGMPIEMGRIHVAPPDYHLVLQNGFIQLSHGPRENLQRPCINVMFRSAATAYGERVAGVLLTGLLDDGAAGMWEIQRCHGTTIFQDPEEAAFRSMPDSAIRGLNVQYIVPLREIPTLLTRLTKAPQTPGLPVEPEVSVEPPSQVCPDCGGVMKTFRMGRLLDFRCHTGHRLGFKSLMAEKSGLVEHSMGTALSQSEELVGLLRTASAHAQPEARHGIEAEIQCRQNEQRELRRLLENTRDASATMEINPVLPDLAAGRR